VGAAIRPVAGRSFDLPSRLRQLFGTAFAVPLWFYAAVRATWYICTVERFNVHARAARDFDAIFYGEDSSYSRYAAFS